MRNVIRARVNGRAHCARHTHTRKVVWGDRLRYFVANVWRVFSGGRAFLAMGGVQFDSSSSLGTRAKRIVGAGIPCACDAAIPFPCVGAGHSFHVGYKRDTIYY